MTFNNWKELYIGGNKLKKLVRVSDGLVLFEKQQEEYPNWICFENLTPEITSTQICVNFEGNVTPSLVYSYDRKSWIEIGTTSKTTNINFDASHQRIWIKAGPGGNAYLSNGTTDYTLITPLGFGNVDLAKVAVRGNIFSLLDGENFESITSVPIYCFNNLFCGNSYSNTVLTDASGIILTNGSLKCNDNTFRQMFYGQKRLEKGPQTPPSIEANTKSIIGVFDSMFNNCIKMESCFDNINIDASKIPNSPSYARFTCRNMFRSTKIKKMGITYTGTKFGSAQFLNMFYGCSELNQIEVNFTTWPSTAFMGNWVNGVSSTGTFICPEALPINYATNRIPPGWTVVHK